MSEDSDAGRQPAPVTAPAETTAAVRKFVAEAGGSAKAVLQPIGMAGVRITLVSGSDGVMGDEVVQDLATAQAVVAAVDGLEESEWDRELVSAATVKPSHYTKMAGWVARQKHFPRPRNRAILK